MPPDKKPARGKTLLQSYLNTFNQNHEEQAVITVKRDVDEDDENGVTYFVDEEGRYYYQQTPDNDNPDGNNGNGDLPEGHQVLVESEGYQTVTLVPSESSNGEISYVLVVQEETKPAVNVDIKEEKANVDVYNFQEEEDEEVLPDRSGDANKDKLKVFSGKRSKNLVRPHFTCNFCAYASHRRYLLLRHMKSHSEDRPHKCGVCERGFKTIASLQNHVNMHNGVKPHVCKYCNSPFTTSGELVRHIRYKHTHEKPHKCTECDYASVELSKLRRHVRCHTGERPYQCPHCTYASPDTFKLKRHLRTHTGEKPYKCDHCNMCFTQSNSLKAHKLIHNVADKPVYACELCPAKCGRKTDLRIHVQKLHTSDKPLKCKRCGKTFPDRYSCKVHNKTHEGEKCFKCNVCLYASTTMRHLKSHMLKHTDEKPFVCDQCDQSFRQKQLLRRHQNLYHNPDYVPKPPKEKTHTCHECNRTFAHKGNLIRHLAVHDPESGHNERLLALKIGRQKKVKYVGGLLKHSDDESENEQEKNENVKIEVGTGPKDLKRGEYVTVGDGDGQQYVVLEVIQLEDGTEQQVAVVAPNYLQEVEEEPSSYIEIHDPATIVEEVEEMEEVEEVEEVEEIEEIEEVEEVEEEEEDAESDEDRKDLIILEKEMPQSSDTVKVLKLEKDVDTCFGFNEEEAGEEEDDYDDKLVLRLV